MAPKQEDVAVDEDESTTSSLDDYSKKQRAYSNSSIYSVHDYSGSLERIPGDKLSLFELLDPLSITTNTLSKKYNQVKEKSLNKFQTLKITTSKKKNEYLGDFTDLDRLKKKFLEKVDDLDSRLNDVFYASTTEKIFYSLALYSIFALGIIVGKYPDWFHIAYTVLFSILMPIRFYTYFKKSYHYFLADLCYYVNGLLMLYIWVFPWSPHLYTSCFAFSFGTLSWAVITWRNSLVLHSIDKTTSSFIHITPPLAMYVITHELSYEDKLERFPGAAKVTHWNFISGILWTSLYYLIWQSLYHYFITIKRAAKIKAGRATSFEWLRKSFKDKWIGKFVNSLPDPFPVIAFTIIQYCYQLLTMSICPLWFAYKPLATGFMGFIFIVASYNGATYYVDFYGRRLEKEVQRLQKEINEVQAENEELIDESDTAKPSETSANSKKTN